MNQTFNFTRFMMLCKKDIIEDWRRILLMIGGMTGCMLVVGIIVAYASGSGNKDAFEANLTAQIALVWYALIALLSGLAITSGLYKSMGKPSTALSTLMCPASGFEKFFMRWIVSVPLFLIGAVLSAMLCDCIRALYIDVVLHSYSVCVPWKELIFGTQSGDFWTVVFMYLFYQSLYMVGAAFFSKNHFLKTFVYLFVVSGIYMIIAGLVLVTFALRNKVYNDLPWDEISGWVWTIAVLFNYLITYVRVREMEIINRW